MAETPPRIILASTSPWRIQMLRAAGVGAEGVDPGVDEAPIVHESPAEMAWLRADAKARAVAARFPHAVIVGADQVCWSPATPDAPAMVFHKPKDAANHLEQLLTLAGRRHQLSTAVAVRGNGTLCRYVEHSAVTLRAAPVEELRAYVESGEGRGCAGGYQVEGTGSWLIDRIDGDWFNVVGLPLFGVLSILRTFGATPPFLRASIALARAGRMA